MVKIIPFDEAMKASMFELPINRRPGGFVPLAVK
jgi:hypothetical protein